MQAYNVEIFSTRFALIHYATVGQVFHSSDYLSTVENEVFLPRNDTVSIGDYIRIFNPKNDDDFFGVISGITTDNVADGYFSLRYKNFIAAKFDVKTLFNVRYQAGGDMEDALEARIANQIDDMFITNVDLRQRIPGLTVTASTSTSPWSFYIPPANEGGYYTIVNLLEDLIRPALRKYQIALNLNVDYQAKQIAIEIRNMSTATQFVIEAELPSVIKKRIVLNERSIKANKLTVYNVADFTKRITYFLHPDGTYDTRDNDRISPVIFEAMHVSVGTGQSLASVAKTEADKLFDVGAYNNLIELTLANDDPILIDNDFQVGQNVRVIVGRESYYSIYTGADVSTTTKLIFGTVRLELTKQLRRILR